MKNKTFIISLSMMGLVLFLGFVLLEQRPSPAESRQKREAAEQVKRAADDKLIKPQQCFDCHSGNSEVRYLP